MTPPTSSPTRPDLRPADDPIHLVQEDRNPGAARRRRRVVLLVVVLGLLGALGVLGRLAMDGVTDGQGDDVREQRVPVLLDPSAPVGAGESGSSTVDGGAAPSTPDREDPPAAPSADGTPEGGPASEPTSGQPPAGGEPTGTDAPAGPATGDEPRPAPSGGLPVAEGADKAQDEADTGAGVDDDVAGSGPIAPGTGGTGDGDVPGGGVPGGGLPGGGGDGGGTTTPLIRLVGLGSFPGGGLYPTDVFDPANAATSSARFDNPRQAEGRVDLRVECGEANGIDSCAPGTAAAEQFADLMLRVCLDGSRQCHEGALDAWELTDVRVPVSGRDVTFHVWLRDTGEPQQQGVATPFAIVIRQFVP